MNRLIPLILLACVVGSAFGMGGAPIFMVGPKTTVLTAEGSHAIMEVNSPSSNVAENKFSSDRLMITARYGVLPNLDVSAQLGAASLNFKDLPAGYSEFDANWTFAWGADVRVGFPAKPQTYQVVAAAKYFGFRPSGVTGNGQKRIESQYLWHEISPTLTAGYVAGPVVPYVGVTKPYLFGQKDVDVTFEGQQFPTAGGKDSFVDGEQSVRGLLGVEWRWPGGYSLAAEAAAASNGIWTISLGISQVLK